MIPGPNAIQRIFENTTPIKSTKMIGTTRTSPRVLKSMVEDTKINQSKSNQRNKASNSQSMGMQKPS
jgi:hypothetical protein